MADMVETKINAPVTQPHLFPERDCAARAFAGEEAVPCAPSARPFVLVATILASAMAFIDGTLVSIAMPAIQFDFSATLVDLQWVANGYLLMLGALILIGGSLGDRVGRRRIFIIGIVIFTAASVGCAVAPTVDFLIGARVLKGIGAALLVPQSLALISASFPKETRGKAIGTWAAASAMTTALGPPLGGFLIDVLSWRAAFWINLPIAIVALWFTIRSVPESRDEGAVGPIDWLGGALITIGIGAFTYGLVGLGESSSGLLISLAAIGLGILLCVLFVARERVAPNPIVPLDLFRSRMFSGGNVVTVLLYGALNGTMFLVPFNLLVMRGLSAAEAGMVLLPFALIIGGMSRYMGSLSDRYGPRPFLTVGPLLVTLGCAGLAFDAPNFILGVVLPMLVIACGMGVVVSPLTTAVMNSAPDERSGAASGVNNAASRLAGVLSVAVIATLASAVYAANAPDSAGSFGILPEVGDPSRVSAEAAFAASYSAGMIIAALLAIAAVIAARLSLPSKPSASGDPS